MANCVESPYAALVKPPNEFDEPPSTSLDPISRFLSVFSESKKAIKSGVENIVWKIITVEAKWLSTA